ncbi:MAG: ATP-binding protein [Chlorobiaceae bacterium]|nr:ATP-binding protein [Chlorobiaceae bacterium]
MKSIIMKRAEIVLPDRYSGYEALNAFIASFAESEGYSTVFTEELQLAMKEAFVNAVKHGNREQEGLTVFCTLTAVANTLLASVMDYGKGFNLDALPNPVEPMNLFRLSGRGIYIIRSIAEGITLKCDQNGSVLTMCYRPR